MDGKLRSVAWGKEVRRPCRLRHERRLKPKERLTSGLGFGGTNLDPTWSPDGRKIAYVTPLNSDTAEIWVVNANGGGLRRLTRNAMEHREPAWSPNGRWLTFVGIHAFGEPPWDIYLVRPDGSGQRRLTRSRKNRFGAVDAAWSPNGQRITFASDRDGDTEIYVMSADGSPQRQLTRNRVSDQAPSWVR